MPQIRRDIPAFARAFRHMGSKVDLVTWDKFLWGSDAKSANWAENLRFWADNAKTLGYEDELDALLYGNAARFLEGLS